MQDPIVIEAGRRTAQQSDAAPVSNGGAGRYHIRCLTPLHDSLRAASEGKPPQARCGSRKTGKISLLVVKLRGTMFMGLRTSAKFKHTYWRLSEKFGIPTKSDLEVIYRLQRELKSNGDAQQKKFRFSWGDFSYVSSENLYSQFDDIFIRQQYAFSCDKSEPVIMDCGGNLGLSAILFKINYPSCHLHN